MGPFAICSGEKCPFVWASSDGGDLPPFFCPLCRRQTIYRCRTCGDAMLLLSLDGAKQRYQCYSCHAPLKRLGPDQNRKQPGQQIGKTA
jgi:hypothetical protein